MIDIREPHRVLIPRQSLYTTPSNASYSPHRAYKQPPHPLYSFEQTQPLRNPHSPTQPPNSPPQPPYSPTQPPRSPCTARPSPPHSPHTSLMEPLQSSNFAPQRAMAHSKLTHSSWKGPSQSLHNMKALTQLEPPPSPHTHNHQITDVINPCSPREPVLTPNRDPTQPSHHSPSEPHTQPPLERTNPYALPYSPTQPSY
ncbi:hypothetical protein ABBQ38_007982 [Trebouxia sp. C0009 RCD-2024]